ncbi:hypothetical protein [Aliarcobacter butzleri]|uniref:hypothetical protein n=1 Tax=Aliarcobacter butzleri TaxID=28197 RepID=UPI003AF66E02
MKNLIERIDQKISFILSALVGNKKKEVTQKELDDLEIESQILEEQLENERELLDDEIQRFNQDINEDIEEDNFSNSCMKIVMNIAMRKGYLDELEEEEFEDCIKRHKYTAKDIEIYKSKNKQVLKQFENMVSEKVSLRELKEELEDILNG